MVIDSFRGKYSFLSNFYLHQIWWENAEYPSVEHAFQASKTVNEKERKVFQCPSPLRPGAAKREGRKLKLRSDWEQIKIDLMRYLLQEKFYDPVLQSLLLDTGSTKLVEGNDWGDVFWGQCNGKGENWLGKLLMEVRESYR